MLSSADNNGAKTQVHPSSPEFGFLEYGLQLAIGASTARISSVHAVSNPHLALQFDKRSKNLLVLPTWVDAGDLDGHNVEEDIVKRGFSFPASSQSSSTPINEGMSFTVGKFRRNDKGSRSICKAYYCDIVVGRSYPVPDRATALRETLPEGYDSFYIQNESSASWDDASSSVNNPSSLAYFHSYVVKSPNQVLPKYVVAYEYDMDREARAREKPKCDNCEDMQAEVYCPADLANLCNKCDSTLHASKLSSRHIRTPIGKGANVFGFCRHHHDKVVEFFCSQCHTPVCVYCKMIGNHSNGEASRHPLVNVADAYQSVLSESQSADPILQQRRQTINNQIAAVNSRAKAVEKMASQIETQIEEAYKQSINQLHVITENKMNVLLGDELELKRQIGEISRLEDFLKYQKSGDSTAFLFSWARHQKFRSDLHDFQFFNDKIDVQIDAKLVGNLSVIVDADQYRSASPIKLTSSPVSKLGKSVASAIKVLPVISQDTVQQLQQDRRYQRRTSDFFADTLGSLEHMSLGSVE